MKNLDNNYYSKDDDITFKMTTLEEQRELFMRAKNGDASAREFLIRNHLLFALTTANSMVKGALPKNEVISAANFAVMKAFDSFKPEYGHWFTTYLRKFIKGEISLLWKSKFNGKSPDPSIGGHEQSADMLDGGVTDPEVEEIDLAKFNRAALGRVLATFSAKDRDLLMKVYFDNKSFADIGRERKVTREAIRASHKRLLKLLKKRAIKEGIER